MSQEQLTLGAAAEPAPAEGETTTRGETRDHVLELVRRKLGDATVKMAGWRRTDDGGLIVEVGTPTRKYAKGKRQGRDDWRGVPTRKAVVVQAEIDAELASYERQTGLCARCCGTKLEWAGWDHLTGNHYETCSPCKGTGQAPAKDKE